MLRYWFGDLEVLAVLERDSSWPRDGAKTGSSTRPLLPDLAASVAHKGRQPVASRSGPLQGGARAVTSQGQRGSELPGTL